MKIQTIINELEKMTSDQVCNILMQVDEMKEDKHFMHNLMNCIGREYLKKDLKRLEGKDD